MITYRQVGRMARTERHQRLESPRAATICRGLSLIRSLIHPRPEAFNVRHVTQTAKIADPPDLQRTQVRRLGKRVWSIANGCSYATSI